MDILFFRTMWGHSGDPAPYAAEARADGYDGLEGSVPLERDGQRALRSALDAQGFELIAEICTGGSYVPDRHATVDEHVDSFKRKLDAAVQLSARHVNCMAGLDAWPLAQSVDFFGRLMDIAKGCGASVSYETHRSRSTFNPWITRDIVLALPELTLTCDFSHWCVVCERLIDTEDEALAQIFPRARHIHGRVGYAQGPQVPHPAAPEFAPELQAHQRWWEQCWSAMKTAGLSQTTMTPEFGPDGYLHRLPFTDMPVADLRQINRWMMQTERAHFERWAAGLPN